jgi:hypothetical protein
LRIIASLVFLIIYQSISFANDVVNLPWAGRNDSSYDSYYKAILHLALEKSKENLVNIASMKLMLE